MDRSRPRDRAELTVAAVAQLAGAIILVVAALFPIVNPPGSTPIFLSLTRGYTPAIRHHLVLRIALNSFLLLTISILIGSHVLHFFGVSIPVVQVAGGLVVCTTGWKLLTSSDGRVKPQAVDDPATASERAFYPLTMPVTVGPGSISVAITLGANAGRTRHPWPALVAALIGPLIIAACIYLFYRSAEQLERVLGDTGVGIFLRLSAFILVCIGVQITWNGVAALVHAL